MRRRAAVLLLCLFISLPACDSAAPDDSMSPKPLTGRWDGQVASRGVTFTFDLELSESNTIISGSGTFTSPQETAGFTVDGSYVHPSINLRLLFTDRPPIMLVGTVRDDRDQIEAQLTGAGFGGETIALTRR